MSRVHHCRCPYLSKVTKDPIHKSTDSCHFYTVKKNSASVKITDSEILLQNPSTRKPNEVDLHLDTSSHSEVYLLKTTSVAPGTILNGTEENLLITPVAGREGFFTRIGIYLPKRDLCLLDNVKVVRTHGKPGVITR